MTRRTIRCWGVIAAFALASAAPAFAADPEKPVAPSAEQRQKMAEVHQKMADCLKSNRPMSECRDEMHQSCKGMMGEAGCPMMGMGKGGMGPGTMGGGMGGMMKSPAAPEAPSVEKPKTPEMPKK